jgi:hypothetical protein
VCQKGPRVSGGMQQQVIRSGVSSSSIALRSLPIVTPTRRGLSMGNARGASTSVGSGRDPPRVSAKHEASGAVGLAAAGRSVYKPNTPDL